MKKTYRSITVARIKRPSNHLLVVSDNYELSQFLIGELKNLSFEHDFAFDLCYTQLNHDPKKMIELGASPIDLKDQLTITNIIKKYDLVFSLHCKQIFPRRLVEDICCINFHPGLNPYNRGWYPQVFSIINGLPAGATVHLMDAEIDHGDIIAQEQTVILPSDTSFEAYMKAITAEKKLIKDNLFDIIHGTFNIHSVVSEGNYNDLNSYRALCNINLNSVGTFREHLNLLRATSHIGFKNAYFIGDDGKKYFVRVHIEQEI